jgi:hypothetical protein
MNFPAFLLLLFVSSSYANVHWNSCGSPPDIFQLKYLDFKPEIVRKGQKLRVLVAGHLREQLNKGAHVLVNIKYGWIRLPNQDLDICDILPSAGLHCPVKAGSDIAADVEIDIPGSIPSGNYALKLIFKNNDQRQVACYEIQAKVQ